MPAPKQILSLIDRFERNKDAYSSGAYNETQIRIEFIDPFFETLGWDIHNKQGYAEAYKDVIHEDAIRVEGSVRAPDYCFRIGGTRKFFLEAKKPSVSIKDSIHPAYQLRRYAWSAKLPLSVLTDFEEFAVYDCRLRPNNDDSASVARQMYLSFRDYATRWDELESVFSREAVLKGSFDRYAEDKKGKKGTAEVDDAFLSEIESWRDALARNIAIRNPSLSMQELNFAVQKTIDRIIFLRICEDRGIETQHPLRILLNGTNVYKRLVEIFYRADERYNSGLFHFQKEKDRSESPDGLTLGLDIDDKVLKDIIQNLYYPQSPYEFSVLPADILGQVYEQFLGKVIRLTAGHRAVVEDKPEVKKAGGVYYTPTYIVDYIVKNTVGRLLEGKTPREISGGAKDPIRVLDPACGSGSFLIVAYQYLLDWYRDRYAEQDAEKLSKGREPKLYQSQGGGWKLTTAERKRILLSHIYGVDIDPQAVEVTKLSLLLKVLEGETENTLTSQLKLFHERALPDLSNNIKCGNSLIGPDFYEHRQMSVLDDDERRRVNAFDWSAEFPEAMKAGGFDAVIGNPPYVRQESLGPYKEYFEQHYKVFQGTADLYSYFIEKGVNLINEHGFFSIIVANKWMRANYGEALRRWLKQYQINEIVDFGDLPVFENATTYPCIINVCRKRPAQPAKITKVESLSFLDLGDLVRNNQHSLKIAELKDTGWSLADDKTEAVINKMRVIGIPLIQYVGGKIFYGIKTGLNDAFVIDEKTKNQIIREDNKCKEIIKPFLMGREIKRYRAVDVKQYLIYIPKGFTRNSLRKNQDPWNWFNKNYPSVSKHLDHYAEKARKRSDQGDFWWELRSCDYYSAFEKPKIILPDISIKGNFTFDISKCFCGNTAYIIQSDDLFLLGLLNSSLITFFYSNISPVFRGGYLRFIFQYLSQIPIKDDKSLRNSMKSLVDDILSLYLKLESNKSDYDKTLIHRQINSKDQQINKLVYELYGLTDKEIHIVEGSTSAP